MDEQGVFEILAFILHIRQKTFISSFVNIIRSCSINTHTNLDIQLRLKLIDTRLRT